MEKDMRPDTDLRHVDRGIQMGGVETLSRFFGGPLHEQERSIRSGEPPPRAYRAPIEPSALPNIVGRLDPSTTHTPHEAVYRLVEVTEMLHSVERFGAPLPPTTELRVVARYEYHGLECPHEATA